METGGAMPPLDHLKHAASEDLMVLIVGSVQVLADRNCVSAKDTLIEIGRDMELAMGEDFDAS